MVTLCKYTIFLLDFKTIYPEIIVIVMIEVTATKNTRNWMGAPKVRAREKTLKNQTAEGIKLINDFGTQYRAEEEINARNRREKKHGGDMPWIVPEVYPESADFSNDFNADFGW